MKSNYLYTTAALALVTIYLLMNGPARDDAPPDGKAVAVKKAPLPSWLPLKEEDLRPKPVPPRADGAMLRQFNNATSLRAFVFEALKKPEQGGYLYAIQALAFCGRQAKLADDASATAARRDALAALVARCDMSKEDMREVSRQAEADRYANYERDPFLRLVVESMETEAPAQRQATVKAILDSGDPLALEAVPLFARHGKPGEEKRGVYFGGRYYDGADNTLFNHAFKLAQCEFGIDCGAGSLVTLAACIDQGWCAASYREALRIGLGPRFAEAEALAAQIAAAIGERKVGAFVKP